MMVAVVEVHCADDGVCVRVCRFEGAIAASKGQAAALTFYAFIGLLCTALVVSIATDLGDNAYLMVVLSPGVCVTPPPPPSGPPGDPLL
jgi:hypothetical protein